MKHDPRAFAAKAYSATYASVSQDDVERRVRQFLPLVRRSAWHIYGAGRDGLEVEDLMQAGIVALTECAHRHSGPTEDGFAAYAKIRVRGAMLDQVRRNRHDSRLARRKRVRYEQTLEKLRTELGREPDRGEVSKAMSLSDRELLDIEASGITISSISEEYDDGNVAFASEDPDPFELLCEAEDRNLLVNAMAELPERLKLVLQLFFVEELNLTEIAAVLSVSVPRVHQLRAKALADLRTLIEQIR